MTRPNELLAHRPGEKPPDIAVGKDNPKVDMLETTPTPTLTINFEHHNRE
jgi:hypothetical protein